MKILSALLLIGAIALLIAALLVYEGVFEIAADVPHSSLVFNIMETARERAIAARAKDIPVPLLDNPERIAKGARDYFDMCMSCHLEPGDKDSELRTGLYPQPPDLTLGVKATPAEMFWVIKHGIKMTAMPAWGLTHDDQRIWNMVAFLRKLPELTPEQFDTLAGASDEALPPDHAAESGSKGQRPAEQSEQHTHHHHHRHAHSDSHK